MNDRSAGQGDLRQKRGRAGEAHAGDWLERQGYDIVETNHRSRYGEIDIIARRGEVVAFIEVKARRGRSFGRPFEAVDHRKQNQIRRMASMWLASHQSDRSLRSCAFRFDVVSVILDAAGGLVTIEMMEDAFR